MHALIRQHLEKQNATIAGRVRILYGGSVKPDNAAELLAPGHTFDGPGIVEAPLTTVVVPPGLRYSIDRHGLGILEPHSTTTTEGRGRTAASAVTERGTR